MSDESRVVAQGVVPLSPEWEWVRDLEVVNLSVDDIRLLRHDAQLWRERGEVYAPHAEKLDAPADRIERVVG